MTLASLTHEGVGGCQLSFCGGRCFECPALVFVLFLSFSESDKEEKPQRTVIPKEVTPALCSLMSSYGSLSGSESEPEGEPWPRATPGFVSLLLPLADAGQQ